MELVGRGIGWLIFIRNPLCANISETLYPCQITVGR